MEGFVSGLQRGAANVPEEGITRRRTMSRTGCGFHGLPLCLLEQILEVRGADAIVAAHGGDGSAEVFAASVWPERLISLVHAETKPWRDADERRRRR